MTMWNVKRLTEQIEERNKIYVKNIVEKTATMESLSESTNKNEIIPRTKEKLKMNH